MYKSGVYSSSRVVSGGYSGEERRQYHSVRIIGYSPISLTLPVDLTSGASS